MGDQDETHEELVHPRLFLYAHTEDRYPRLEELVRHAEMAIPIAQRLAALWQVERLPTERWPEVRSTLAGRCAAFGVVANLRGAQLAEGLAREVEVDALHPAASVARSLLELVGITCYARSEMAKLATERDDAALSALSLQLLVGSRATPEHTGFHHVPTSRFINAARQMIGDHFGDDYAHLSDLTHPNMLARAAVEATGEVSFRNLGIDEGSAELLVKIGGQGLNYLVHNALMLIEWADSTDRPFA